MTEITENINWKPLVLYDGNCPFCTTWVQRFQPALCARGFRCVSLQDFTKKHRDIRVEKPYKELIVRTTDGKLLGGAEAIIHIAHTIWWALPFVAISKLPFVMPLLRKAYRWVAARRHCLGSACALEVDDPGSNLISKDTGKECRKSLTTSVGWMLFIILVSGAFTLKPVLPAWGFMWAMTVALFLGFKCLLLLRAWAVGLRGKSTRILKYFIAWPRMDTEDFFNRASSPVLPNRVGKALVRLLSGAFLFWIVARWIPSNASIARGWIGMTGLVLMLHFGVIELLSIAWRTKPIMQAPIRAKSVSEFWGSRWNTIFSQMAHQLIIQPLKKRLGIRGAILCVFAVSGFLHELVISVPASGGYGLPTIYFLIQGTGLVIDRRFGESGRSHTIKRRVFAWVIVAGPVFWLFHPLFVEQVILPMMHAWGAL